MGRLEQEQRGLEQHKLEEEEEQLEVGVAEQHRRWCEIRKRCLLEQVPEDKDKFPLSKRCRQYILLQVHREHQEELVESSGQKQLGLVVGEGEAEHIQ